jgi:hypothetical protein
VWQEFRQHIPHVVQEINRLTLQPGGGLWMTFKPRPLA